MNLRFFRKSRLAVAVLTLIGLVIYKRDTYNMNIPQHISENARNSKTVEERLLGQETKLVPLTQWSPALTSTEKHFCMIKSSWHTDLSAIKQNSNMSDWTFKTKTKCSKNMFSSKMASKRRLQLQLHCSLDYKAKPVTSWTNSSRDIASVEFGDPCLGDYIRTCCTDNKPVPNVVHYVWYKDGDMDFFTFVSFISVIRFVRPCVILIHGEFIPRGVYWDYVINVAPNIIRVNRERPLYIFGKKLKFKEHSADIMRIDAIKEYGGIYLDTDTILVRSIEPLRAYEYTGSRQPPYLLNAFIMGKNNATFLNFWLDGYRYNYKNDSYLFNSMQYPNTIAYNHALSDIIHIEDGTISRPNGQTGNKIHVSNYNWTHVYGMHLFKKINRIKNINETIIRTLNTTVGSMCRHILYGNKDLCTAA